MMIVIAVRKLNSFDISTYKEVTSITVNYTTNTYTIVHSGGTASVSRTNYNIYIMQP